MGATVTRGMVLAAGLGKRMRPITERTPKPLVEVAGRSLLDRALDRFAEAGIATVVVNTHHLADQVAARLGTRRDLALHRSHEPELLETGGGVLQALPLLSPGPFAVANSDALWTDGEGDPALARLAGAWDDAAMDGLLLLVPRERAPADMRGDFDLEPDGRLRRRSGDTASYVFIGVQLLHERLFAGAAPGAFSLNLLYDKALAAGRLHGLVHSGGWHHVGTPDQLAAADAALAAEA